MKTIYLVRHCIAKGQEPDAELTEEGMLHAEKLGDFLFRKNIKHIVASPYTRALQTADPLAKKLNLHIIQDERLVERVLCSENHPDWLTMLEKTFTDLELRYEGGESSRMAATRGISVIAEILNQPSSPTAIFSHGNLIALILGYFDNSYGFAQWKALSNPDIFQLTFLGYTPEINRVWTIENKQSISSPYGGEA